MVAVRWLKFYLQPSVTVRSTLPCVAGDLPLFLFSSELYMFFSFSLGFLFFSSCTNTHMKHASTEAHAFSSLNPPLHPPKSPNDQLCRSEGMLGSGWVLEASSSKDLDLPFYLQPIAPQEDVIPCTKALKQVFTLLAIHRHK